MKVLTCEVHVGVAAKAQDVADGLVGALGLHHNGHVPDVRHVAHVEHMSRCHLAKEGLQDTQNTRHCKPAGQQRVYEPCRFACRC